MRVGIAWDQGGFALRTQGEESLPGSGHEVIDLDTERRLRRMAKVRLLENQEVET